MELNKYQARVLEDLQSYLEALDGARGLDQAFKAYWNSRGVRVGAVGDDASMGPYKNTVAGVPHVCAKVPTAGGKTFIAVNALSTILSALSKINPKRPKMVVWLVPSITILDQTIKALSTPGHPYRQRLDTLFRSRVAIYEKRDLLAGAGFNLDTSTEQLSIVVMSFDSLRAKNKEDRKIYQDNGNLASFLLASSADDTSWLLPEYDATALINVIRRLRPVVIVDESHNAESPLSVEMLVNLNPDFILDLTATPRNNSNIISYIDAMALKKANMVKLPVIVANRSSKAEVVEGALIMRRQLENLALQEEKRGGKYIRPIVLFQAQPRIGEDSTTFDKIRKQLMALDIPEEEIKIKTAEINELKGLDLMSPKCDVRYIITVNALKEGWDCPFAYILASLADKSSPVDVEQILGRVLRMPHVRQHGEELLNMSYVFTASNKFQDTLASVVKALNRAGFTDKDFRAVDCEQAGDGALVPVGTTTPQLFDNELASVQADGQPAALDDPAEDISAVPVNWAEIADEAEVERGKDSVSSAGTDFVAQIKAQALTENRDFEAKAKDADETAPAELEPKMNRHRIKEIFRTEALAIQIPQFFIKVPTGGFFDEDQPFQIFEKEELLKDFKLSQADSTINFDDIDSDVYRVDLEKQGEGDYAPKAFKMAAIERARFTSYILGLSPASQVLNLVDRLAGLVGNMYPITDPEIRHYIRRIVDAMTPEQVRDCVERDFAYVRKIKQKITTLANVHSQKRFTDMLDVDAIAVRPGFAFAASITPGADASHIAKSLYSTEASMGSFEAGVINDIAGLSNVHWWHRNLSRGKGFRINGFINHYPDFIVRTTNGKTVVIETKGDDRDNTDSEFKLKLGKLWEKSVSRDYRYMMVFENNPVAGAERLSDALKKLALL